MASSTAWALGASMTMKAIRCRGGPLANPEKKKAVLYARTVGYHVSNILNKTAVANRTEAAAYATRRGLG